MSRVILVVCLVAWLSSCATPAVWQKEPPPSLKQSEHLRALSYCEIPEDQVERYLRELEDTPVIRVSKKDVGRLCNTKLGAFDVGGDSYVIRALYIGKYGPYQIRTDGRSVWVDHQSLAGRAVAVSRSALVIFLETHPASVYVTAYADE